MPATVIRDQGSALPLGQRCDGFCLDIPLFEAQRRRAHLPPRPERQRQEHPARAARWRPRARTRPPASARDRELTQLRPSAVTVSGPTTSASSFSSSTSSPIFRWSTTSSCPAAFRPAGWRGQRLPATRRHAEARPPADAPRPRPESLHRREVTRLSVGQQQRVAAARALIGQPEIVIADEPTSALDAERQGAFLDLLRDECERSGSTLLFVSHDRRLAAGFDRELSLSRAGADVGQRGHAMKWSAHAGRAQRLEPAPDARHDAGRRRPQRHPAARRRARSPRSAQQLRAVGLRDRPRRRRPHQRRATDALRRLPPRRGEQQHPLAELPARSRRIRPSPGPFRCRSAIRITACRCSARPRPTSSISATATGNR
jgi:hypothetical protein